MKGNKLSRNTIETFFFHSERIYTVKGKKRGKTLKKQEAKSMQTNDFVLTSYGSSSEL